MIRELQELVVKVYSTCKRRRGILFWISGSCLKLYVWQKNPFADPECFEINRDPVDEEQFQRAKERLVELLIEESP